MGRRNDTIESPTGNPATCPGFNDDCPTCTFGGCPAADLVVRPDDDDCDDGGPWHDASDHHFEGR
jgi:hypothetical protein